MFELYNTLFLHPLLFISYPEHQNRKKEKQKNELILHHVLRHKNQTSILHFLFSLSISTMSKVYISIFILALLGAFSYLSLNDKGDCPFFECPTSDSYPQTCLDNVIPPWPICKLGSVDHWVEHAKDGATRCCGDDLSQCRCPKKDTKTFLDTIGAWCDGVSTCSDGHGEDQNKLLIHEDYVVTE